MRSADFFAVSVLVLCLSAPSVALGNLVVNGDFETTDSSGWVLAGDQGYSGVVCGPGFGHLGNCARIVGPLDWGYMSQTLTTIPGASYELSFWLHNEDVANDNGFTASWGGNVVYSLTNASNFLYTQVTIPDLLALTDSTELQFGFVNQIAYWMLDDVSVIQTGGPSAVPEPSTMALAGLALGVLALRRRVR